MNTKSTNGQSVLIPNLPDFDWRYQRLAKITLYNMMSAKW